MSTLDGSKLQFFQWPNTLSLRQQVCRRNAFRGHSYLPASRKNQLLVAASVSFYLTKYWPDTWQLNGNAHENNTPTKSNQTNQSVSQSLVHFDDCTLCFKKIHPLLVCAIVFFDRKSILIIFGTRKPCYRKETARCRNCSFQFKVRRRHSLQV